MRERKCSIDFLNLEMKNIILEKQFFNRETRIVYRFHINFPKNDAMAGLTSSRVRQM
jgi:hypothetical protein